MSKDGTDRNYQVVALTKARPPTVITQVLGDDPSDTGITPKDFVGDRAALQPGGLFDYFTPGEKQILRGGLRR